MIKYFTEYYVKLFMALGEHIQLLLITMFFGTLISLAICFLIYNIPFLSSPVMAVLKILYTIPSLAFFSILIPISGIGSETAIIVLVAYTLFFLVRSFLEGLNGIDPDVVEAGKAMGYSTPQLFFKIQLPLSIPSLLNGIRFASVSTIGISCIAYAIGAGGLGSILFEGMRQISYVKILWGSIMVVLLNVIVNISLLQLEKFIVKRLHLNH